MVSTPSPPDPQETAAAQQALNKETAVTQYELGATNQITPYGNLSYEQTGTSSSGNPTYTATQTLSPNQQALLTGSENLGLGMLGVAQNQLGNVSDALSQPVDLSSSATEDYLYGLASPEFNQQWDQQQAQLETQLANQGIAVGSQAYTDAMNNFGQQKTDAWDQLLLSGHQTATSDILAERNQPLNELGALMSGGQVTPPTYAQTPQPGVQGVDYTGLVNQQYQAELAQSQAMMSGLFGIPTAILGGWAQSGFA